MHFLLRARVIHSPTMFRVDVRVTTRVTTRVSVGTSVRPSFVKV